MNSSTAAIGPASLDDDWVNDTYPSDAYTLSTPERVDLEYDVAGLGSRFVAALVDLVVQIVVVLALLVVAGLGGWLVSLIPGRGLGLGSLEAVPIALAVVVLLVFLVIWGYYIFFELVWNGQSPGKRLAGIRVLTTTGQPVTLAHSLIRNLVRIVDFLPSNYMLGAMVMLLNGRARRLGDLAAGTIVVKERRAAAPPMLGEAQAEWDGPELAPQAAATITAEDVALAREFLLRRAELAPARRGELAEQIAARLRARLGPSPPSEAAEPLLARVAALKRRQ